MEYKTAFCPLRGMHAAPVVYLATGAAPPPPPLSCVGGATRCIFQKKPACWLLTAAWWHVDTFTDRGNLEPGIQGDDPELHISETEGFVCCVLKKAHLPTRAVVLLHEMQTS